MACSTQAEHDGLAPSHFGRVSQSVTEVHHNLALGENFPDQPIKESDTQHTDLPVTCGLYRHCRRSECASASGWRLLEECCCSPLDVSRLSQVLQRSTEIERGKGGDLQREKSISPEWRQPVGGDLGVFNLSMLLSLYAQRSRIPLA